MKEKLDIILFGASGFTGKHTLPVLSKFANSRNLTWGVAGRSEKKLKQVLTEYEAKSDFSCQNIEVILADVKDEESLRKMARRTRLLINCCGPYMLFGEAVVKACVEEGTHHIDVSGEVQFIEEMQLKYDKTAQEKGVYVISACGFESIPYDLGVVFLQENFQGTLNSVEAYLATWEEGTTQGPIANSGSWNSAVNVMKNIKQLKTIRKKLFPDRLPKFVPKLKMKLLPHRVAESDGWTVPFRSTDRTVINRSQRCFFEKEQKRPVQVETYITLQSLLQLIFFAIGGFFLLVLSRFEFGAGLLLKYPKLFTFGYLSDESPNEETIEKNRFCLTLIGKGWKETLPTVYYEYPYPPNKAIVAKIKGSNLAYGATCICLVLAGVTILMEKDKMPQNGGVLPPGYAFAKTSLLKQLNNSGVSFEIIKEKHL